MASGGHHLLEGDAEVLARLEEASALLAGKLDLSGGAHWRNEARMVIARTYAQAGVWDETFRTVAQMNDSVLTVHALLAFFRSLPVPGGADSSPDFQAYLDAL